MPDKPVTCPNCGAEISPTLAAQVISAQRKTHSGGRRPLKTGPVSRVTEWRRRKKAEADAVDASDSGNGELTAYAGWRRLEARDGMDATYFRNILTGADASVSGRSRRHLRAQLAIPLITPSENEIYWEIRRRGKCAEGKKPQPRK